MKAVQLTDDEIAIVIQYHATQITNMGDGYAETIERMKYLNKRLEDKPKETIIKDTSTWQK